MPDKARICIVIGTFHPIIGGAETLALVQGRNLRDRGFETSIVTFRFDRSWPEREETEGVPIIRVAGRLLGGREKFPRPVQQLLYLLSLFVLGWKLWRWRHQYDLLHVHQLTLLTLPTALVSRLTGKPMLIVVHSSGSGQAAKTRKGALVAGPLDPTTPWLQVDGNLWTGGDLADLERFGRPITRAVRSLLERAGAHVVILSSRMKQYLIHHDFYVSNVWLVPNGVDTSRFPPTASGAAPGDRALTVVCISRLSFEKGIDVLLQAWHLVHTQLPAARLIIVGNGQLEEQLMHLAQALDILESVEFTGVRSDIVNQLHRGRLAVLPSRVEGMPVALLEAMACRLCCVATRVSGSEDIIQHGVNGLLVEPEDYQALAGALLTLLRDPDLAERYARMGRLTIEQHYTLERITDMYIELYSKMTKRGQGVEDYVPA